MRVRLLVVVVAGLLVGADPAPDVGEVQSQEIPPGSKWIGGNPWGETSVEEFKHGVWRTYNPDEGIEDFPEGYTLNPQSFPPRIDTERGRLRRHGIYRLEGGRLLICMGRWDTPNRPTAFVNRPEAGQFLYILQRLK